MGLRTFTFGGTASSTYSMFITEAATYNVPERAVEMLEIPGRNGAYALDQGRFENVEVTYHVVVHKDTNANFQTELSSVRNWLASKVGYQRLTDDYNSNVYRMAIFKGGLETDETFVNGAEFDIVFECKPQRWLTSGETATAVANNGTLSNPTLFDSEPLLAVKGYGTIGFNGYEIEIENGALGTIQLASGQQYYDTTTISLNNVSSLNASDVIYFSGDSVTTTFIVRDLAHRYIWTSGTVSSSSNIVSASFTKHTTAVAGITIVADTSTRFAKGTSSTITSSATIYVNGEGTGTLAFSMTITFAYDGNDQIVVTKSITKSGTYAYLSDVKLGYGSDTTPEVYGDSTKNFLGNPTYIDCEVGECYKYEGAEIVSLNGVISLGSDLPKLSSGTNTFTYDNTITELKVTPRYWKV